MNPTKLCIWLIISNTMQIFLIIFQANNIELTPEGRHLLSTVANVQSNELEETLNTGMYLTILYQVYIIPVPFITLQNN